MVGCSDSGLCEEEAGVLVGSGIFGCQHVSSIGSTVVEFLLLNTDRIFLSVCVSEQSAFTLPAAEDLHAGSLIKDHFLFLQLHQLPPTTSLHQNCHRI